MTDQELSVQAEAVTAYLVTLRGGELARIRRYTVTASGTWVLFRTGDGKVRTTLST